MASSSTELYYQYSNPRSNPSQPQKGYFEPRSKTPQHSRTRSESYFLPTPPPPPSLHSHSSSINAKNPAPDIEKSAKELHQLLGSPALSCIDDALGHLPQLRVWSQDDNEAHPVDIPTPTETVPRDRLPRPKSRSSSSRSRSKSREPIQLYAPAPAPPAPITSNSNLLAGSGAVAVPIRPSSRSSHSHSSSSNLNLSSSWAESAILSRERVSSPLGRTHSASYVEPSSGWPTAMKDKDTRRTQSASHIEPGSGWPSAVERERERGEGKSTRARSPMARRENESMPIHRPVPQVAGAGTGAGGGGAPAPPALLSPEMAGDSEKEKKRSKSKSPRPHTPYPLPIPTMANNNESSPLLTLPDGLRIRLPTSDLQLANGALVLPTPQPVTISQPATNISPKKEPSSAPVPVPTSLSRRPTVASISDSQLTAEPSLLFGGEFNPRSLPAQATITPERTMPERKGSLTLTRQDTLMRENSGRPSLERTRSSKSFAPDISTANARYPHL